MSTEEMVAVGVAAVVAYAGIAGVAWRIIGRPELRDDEGFIWGFSVFFGWSLAVVYGTRRGLGATITNDDRDFYGPGVILYWPLALGSIVGGLFLRAAFLPLRAVFRLASRSEP